MPAESAHALPESDSTGNHIESLTESVPLLHSEVEDSLLSDAGTGGPSRSDDSNVTLQILRIGPGLLLG